MEIIYDPDADAMYIEFSKAEWAKNKKIDDNTIIDLDKSGKIIGIELLSVKKRIPLSSLSDISFKNLVNTKKIAA